jgi:hypothetical protein
MQPTIEQKRQFVQQEFARRNAGQMPSSAGIGAGAVNTPDPNNPIPTTQMTNPPAISGGAAGNPSDGAVAGMKTQKGEATKLAEALVWRMKKLTSQGQ